MSCDNILWRAQMFLGDEHPIAIAGGNYEGK